MVSHRPNTKWLILPAMLLSMMILPTTQASADLGEFAPAGTFKAGEIDEGIAIDESTNDVYIYETKGRILKFDTDGNPVNFSSLGGNAITEAGFYGSGETELAVDNSSGPAKGDIYLAGGSGVEIFGADGKKLGKITQVAGRPWGEVACGVAVDGAGNVYVGLYNGGSNANVNEYTPTTNPVTSEDYVASHGGLNEICEIAASPKGAVYASTWNPDKQTPIVEFDNIHDEGAKEIVASAGGALTVADTPSEELFFSHVPTSGPPPSVISQYDSHGNPLSEFGAGKGRGYYTIGVNAKDGRLYAFDHSEIGEVEIWQGVIKPEIRTSEATGTGPAGGATLNGTVNPEGVPVESCSFEYGLSASYGSALPCAQNAPLTGTATLPVSASLSGLSLNHEYHYRLSATDAQGTINGADETFTILVKPTVEDQSPTSSGITRASAKLTGTINPNEGETHYHFEYGPTESYGNDSQFAQTGAGAGDVTVSQQLTDLIPNTTYHYRLVAKNVAGIVEGADHTFTTGAPTPPAAATGAANGVAQNAAVITGAVQSNGLPTSYGFEIGTSTDYGPPTGLGTVGASTDELPVALGLAGLVPGTTYHYRITATNVDGTTYGVDQAFTTTVFASTFAEPPAPLPFVTVPVIAFPSEAKPVVKKPAKKVKKKSKKHGKAAKGRKKAKNKKKK